MLYVAIWYVSIRYEGEGRTAVLPSAYGLASDLSNVSTSVPNYNTPQILSDHIIFTQFDIAVNVKQLKPVEP
jgi:hypothetical protein